MNNNLSGRAGLIKSSIKIKPAYLIWVFIFLLLYYISTVHFLLFHIIVELISIMVAFLITVFAFNSWKEKNKYLMFLGIAYAFVGLIDFHHLLVYKGMNIIPGYDSNLSVQLWIVARYVEAISLFVFSLFNINLKWKRSLYIYTVIILFLLFLIFNTNLFPVCFIGGKGLTTFKIISEYIIILILIFSVISLKNKRLNIDNKIYRYIVSAIILTIVSEVLLTSYIYVYGIINVLGHIVKFISIYLIFKVILETGLKEPYRLLFSSLEEEKEKLHTYIDKAEVIFLILDENGIIEYLNNKGCETLGYPRQEITGKYAFNYIPLVEKDYIKNLFEDYINKNIELNQNISSVINREQRLIRIKWFITRINFSNGKTNKVLCSGIDITKEKELEKKIEYMGYHDKLTGLYNRDYFERMLNIFDKEEYLPVSIIMGDINGLKMINDIFSYEKGNFLISRIGDILKNSIPDKGIVARWGGDEFSILLPNSTEEESLEIIKSIKQSCESISDDLIEPSIALGTDTKTVSTQNISKCLKKAEKRVYKNKLMDKHSIRSTLIYSLEKTLAEKDFITQEHIDRVGQMAKMMGGALNISGSRLDDLLLISSLHDLGKIAIPDNILNKPGPLDEKEWEIMKKHSEIGYRIAESSPQLSSIARGILHHHERWDGTGYPAGLAKKEIPLISRIVAVIDTYDVMTHDRPYREAITTKEALNEIKRCSGTQFDPQIAKTFLDLMAKDKII